MADSLARRIVKDVGLWSGDIVINTPRDCFVFYAVLLAQPSRFSCAYGLVTVSENSVPMAAQAAAR